ncbi:MAG: hypothetical protein AB2693_23250 [Candidatus Thiodiazotropha sp.]
MKSDLEKNIPVGANSSIRLTLILARLCCPHFEREMAILGKQLIIPNAVFLGVYQKREKSYRDLV